MVFTETRDDEEEEEELSRVTYVNNIMHSIFPKVEVYINNERITIPMDSKHTSLTPRANSRQPSLNTRDFCILKAMTMNRILRILLTPYLSPFSRRMKLLSGPDGFMLYGKLRFFSTSELLYPNRKIILHLIRARSNFRMISDNLNVNRGIVDCSLYTRRFAPKDDYHKKRRDMLAYAPVKYNYLEFLAETFIKSARQNQYSQENIFNTAPIRRVAIAMNKNSGFTGSFTETPFWYQQFDLRQTKLLRGGQPTFILMLLTIVVYM